MYPTQPCQPPNPAYVFDEKERAFLNGLFVRHPLKGGGGGGTHTSPDRQAYQHYAAVLNQHRKGLAKGDAYVKLTFTQIRNWWANKRKEVKQRGFTAPELDLETQKWCLRAFEAGGQKARDAAKQTPFLRLSRADQNKRRRQIRAQKRARDAAAATAARAAAGAEFPEEEEKFDGEAALLALGVERNYGWWEARVSGVPPAAAAPRRGWGLTRPRRRRAAASRPRCSPSPSGAWRGAPGGASCSPASALVTVSTSRTSSRRRAGSRASGRPGRPLSS